MIDQRLPKTITENNKDYLENIPDTTTKNLKDYHLSVHQNTTEITPLLFSNSENNKTCYSNSRIALLYSINGKIKTIIITIKY